MREWKATLGKSDFSIFCEMVFFQTYFDRVDKA